MKILLLFALLWLPLLGSAQSFTVRGTVRSQADKAPLPGVTVLETGTRNGVSTDAAGRFVLTTTQPRPRLQFHCIGFQTTEVAITKNEPGLTVLLQESHQTLSEVAVTGAAEAPADVSYATPALAARVPGIRIRGAATLAASAASIEAMPASPGRASGYGGGRAGVLTAGELNDFGKWQLWPDVAEKDLSEWRQHWRISPLQRYSVQLVTAEGFAVVGAPVVLRAGRDSVVWAAQTDNTGKCELWNGLFAAPQPPQSLSIHATVGGRAYALRQPTVFQQGINVIRVQQACEVPAVVDVAFVVDATGSMGDEIGYLQAELGDVLAKTRDSLAGCTVRVGSVFYRDQGDEYLTRSSPLSPNVQRTVEFMQAQHAGGGGDFPEAVDAALSVAVNELDWHPQARARLLFLLLDAPPHETPAVLASLEQSIRRAAARGIRVVPVAASGIDKSTEYLMRSLALATNGTYVFLTDDSGVGNAHLKPTTDKFDVELLNTLLAKLMTRYARATSCQTPLARAGGQPAPAPAAGRPAPPAGTNAADRPSRWKCYPNPTTDVLHVEVPASVTELFVTDAAGKLLLRAVPAGGQATLTVGSFPTGLYFLRFLAGKRWETARFLVSR